MALTPGSKLGPYEILGAIGAGGMGEVYRARDTRLDRDVAIKVLPAAFAQDAERLRRFEQEARVVATLNHPNILAIFDIGSEAGVPYLVTELLEGEPLRDKLKAGALPARRALEYATGIAHGLAAAHEKGIIHRDLKPENVFLTRDGRVKVLDFGLAKLTRGEAAAAGTGDSRTIDHATSPGMLLGTVEYMSPEQVRGNAADGRSDIFALGVLLYEMLAGRRAFHRETGAETMTAILKEDPPEFDPSHPVPPGLERIVRRCLEKAPEQRFQSARDLAFALEAVSGLSHGSSVSGIAPAMAAAKTHNWRTPALITGLLVFAALAYVAGRGNSRGASIVGYKQVSYRPQTIFAARYSPDGKTIVFAAADQGVMPTLYTISQDYPEPKSTGLTGVQLLAVSRKGELAVLTRAQYVAQRIFRGTLARMPLGSAAPREIMADVEEADWSPDGEDLAIIREINGQSRLEYPIGTILYQTSAYVSDLRFSPDGKRIAFFDHPWKYDDRGFVSVIEVATKKKTDLIGGFWGMEGLAWSNDGTEVFFSGSTSGAALQPRAVTLAGKSRVLMPIPGSLELFDVSAAGEHLVARQDLQMKSVATDPATGQERDVSWLDFSIFPTVSNDGKLVSFSEMSAAAGATYSSCVRRTDGSPTVVVGEGAGPMSPDGKWVAALVPSTPAKLMLYPTGAGQARQLERGSVENYSANMRFFADSEHLEFCGSEAGRPPRCFVQSITAGAPKAVTPEGTVQAWPSPDGKSVLALSGDWKMAIYPLDGGQPRPVPHIDVLAGDTVMQWTSDGRSVMLFRTNQIPARVEKVDLATGKRTLVRLLSPPDRSGTTGINWFSFSPDEKWYAYSYSRNASQLYTASGVK